MEIDRADADELPYTLFFKVPVYGFPVNMGLNEERGGSAGRVEDFMSLIHKGGALLCHLARVFTQVDR